MNEDDFKKLTEYIWQRFSRAREMHFEQLFRVRRDPETADGFPPLSTEFAQRWAHAYFVDGLYGIRPRFRTPDESRSEDFVDGIRTGSGNWIGWDAPATIGNKAFHRRIAGIDFSIDLKFADRWIDVFSERESEQTLAELALTGHSDELDARGAELAFSELAATVEAAAGVALINSERLKFWASRMSRIELRYSFTESEEGRYASFELLIRRPRFDGFAEDEQLGAKMLEYARELQRDQDAGSD